MIFSSYDFIFIFLPLVVISHYSLSYLIGPQGSVAVLVLFSFAFYGAWNPYHLWIIATSILVNYTLGRLLSSSRSSILFAVGISLNLALIFVYKYFNFFVDTVGAVASPGWSIGNLVLPLGISFFTFQQIAWLVDCWRGRVDDFNPFRYALFISFFPQLIAGPIVHSSDVMPQFASLQNRMTFARNIAVGASIFVIGLSKKVLIADRLAPFADYVFGKAKNGVEVGVVDAWAGLSSYTLQIYFDFSAYSDMAIGLALLFGISLPMNFNSPYKAVSIQHFWRRWHMTLSRFLRDYLYFPLGGGRLGAWRRSINLMITMLLGGLWHGAAWTFVAWGALHGLFLLLHRLWSEARNRHFPSIEIPVIPAIAFTFLCVALAWVPFRAESFAASLDMYAQLFAFRGPVFGDLIRSPEIFGVPETLARNMIETFGIHANYSGILVVAGLNLFALTLVFATPNTAEIFRSVYQPPNSPSKSHCVGLQWTRSYVWLCVICGLAIICFVFMRRQAPFLYFQF